MRYQEWWWTQIPKEFEARGFEVLVVGKGAVDAIKERRSAAEMFSPIDQSIELEAEQIKEYMKLELRDDDILFWADISFPGIFGHVLFHKRPKRMYAFCHATSMNHYDYYEPVRAYKYPIEKGICGLFDKIFVGSKYHRAKLGWKNIMVTYLPFPPMKDDINITSMNRPVSIMSASRPSIQKVDSQLEKQIEDAFCLKIQRHTSKTWFEYFWNLSLSKILLITAREDTFGYQIVDAILNNCIPLARNSFAYPELLPREYLYDSKEELILKIDNILNMGMNMVPRLLCEEQMNNFYDTICNEMKGENKDLPF
jgi:hypothetical protein